MSIPIYECVCLFAFHAVQRIEIVRPALARSIYIAELDRSTVEEFVLLRIMFAPNNPVGIFDDVGDSFKEDSS
jgi:hypothetical protein